MTTALATRPQNGAIATYSAEEAKKRACVREQCAKGTTEDEFEFYLTQCHRLGLDPLLKHAYMLPRGRDGKRFELSIDGFRVVAAQCPDYAGSAPPKYAGTGTLANGKEHPKGCTITVYKMVQGQKCEFSGFAAWNDFYNPTNDNWNKLPFRMLAVRAETEALKKAFGKQLGGIYTPDEMDDAEDVPRSSPAEVPPMEKDAEVVEAQFVEDTPAQEPAYDATYYKDKFTAQARNMGYEGNVGALAVEMNGGEKPAKWDKAFWMQIYNSSPGLYREAVQRLWEIETPQEDMRPHVVTSKDALPASPPPLTDEQLKEAQARRLTAWKRYKDAGYTPESLETLLGRPLDGQPVEGEGNAIRMGPTFKLLTNEDLAKVEAWMQTAEGATK